jgi:tellurium resistance protein TerD
MAVSLVKGGNVSLTKEAPSMNVALVGLGWDARVTDGQAFDLDASVFLVGEDGKVLSDSHFVFYNNTTSPDGAVQHQGDNRTGEGDGDDEQVKIELAKVGADVKNWCLLSLFMKQKPVNRTSVWSATATCVW